MIIAAVSRLYAPHQGNYASIGHCRAICRVFIKLTLSSSSQAQYGSFFGCYQIWMPRAWTLRFWMLRPWMMRLWMPRAWMLRFWTSRSWMMRLWMLRALDAAFLDVACFGCPVLGCFDRPLCRPFWMYFGCCVLWMLRFWMSRVLDATSLDAMIWTRGTFSLALNKYCSIKLDRLNRLNAFTEIFKCQDAF